MEPISPFLLKRKEKTQNFSFQSRDSFLKKHLIIFFFFQTDFHACLGVESWFLKSMSDWRGQNSWVYLWMHSYFSTCLPVRTPSPFMSYSLLLPDSHWLGSPVWHHLKNRSSTAVGDRDTFHDSMWGLWLSGSGWHESYWLQGKEPFAELPFLGSRLMN